MSLRYPPKTAPLAILLALALPGAWSGRAAAQAPVGAAIMAPEKIAFRSRDRARTPIAGWLFRPTIPIRGGAVLLHGCSGPLTKAGRLRPREAFWARMLARNGYLALILDSFNPRGYRTICGKSRRPITPRRKRPGDAYGAFTALLRRGAPANNMVLMGWSHGAMTGLAILNGRDPRRSMRMTADFRQAILFYPGCRRYERRGFRTGIATMLLLGGADDWTAPGPCIRMAAAARASGSPIKTVRYPGAYHGFDIPDLPVRTRWTRNRNWQQGRRRVHVGTNDAARRNAIKLVQTLVRKPPG